MAKQNLTMYCADIHGYGYLLDKAIHHFQALPSDTKLVLLGDYMDRGPQNKYCLETVKQLHETYSDRVHPLMGNHEELFTEFLRNGFLHPNNGTHITLQEFAGLDNFQKFIQGDLSHKNIVEIIYHKHNHLITYMESLDDYYEDTHQIGVHAGLDLEHVRNNTQRSILLWTREEYFNQKNTLNKAIVTGHTPIELVVSHFKERHIPHKTHYDAIVETEDKRLFIDKGIFKYDQLNTVILDGDGVLVDIQLFT